MIGNLKIGIVRKGEVMKKNSKGTKVFIIAFMAPTLILYVLYLLLPTIMTVYTGFTEWDGVSTPVFTGLANYKKLMSDLSFRSAIKNTVIWMISLLAIQLPLAALSAIVLRRKPAGWKVMRAIIYLPVLISLVSMANIWRMGVYEYSIGALNMIMNAFGMASVDWLGGLNSALICTIATLVFYPGYYSIIILASLTAIPENLYEAAEIDGASKLQTDLHITIPYMKTIYGTCTLLSVISALKIFDTTYTLTAGGPAGRSTTLACLMYQNISITFKGGYANSIGTILILVGIIAVAITNVVTKKFEIEG